MKTSNKLVLACAILIIAIPILLMAYEGNRFFEDFEKETPAVSYQRNTAPLASEIPNRVKHQTENFNRIEINGEKDYAGTRITLNKANNYGLTINKPYRNLITYSVANGVLKLTLSKYINANEQLAEAQINVYAPVISKLLVNNAKISVNAKQNQLAIKGSNAQFYFNFLPEEKESQFFSIDSLDVDLDRNSRFLTSASYKNLTVKSKNNSSLDLTQNQNMGIINHLDYQSTGINQLSVKDYKIGRFTGNISPQTGKNLPKDVLQLLNK